MDVVVEAGGWEHACCGPAIERNQLVDLSCLRVLPPDGEVNLSETHHDLEPDIRVQDESETFRSRAPGNLLSRCFAYRAGRPCGASTRTTATSRARRRARSFPMVMTS